MRTLILSLMLAVGLSATGATVKYYDDYPSNSNPPTTYIISLQTGDETVGGTPYNFWTLGQMVAWLQLRGFTNGSGTIINIVTNNVFVNTNTIIATSNAFFNNTYTTNLTVVVPGGFTNLTVTASTLAYWDINQAAASIPNDAGFLTNNGTGGIGWSTVLAVTEVDAQNAYLTNTLIFITNKFAYPNGDGQLVGLANASGVLQNDGSGGFSWVVGPPPGGSAGGVLSGTYPNPGFGSFTSATLAAALSDETGAGLATFSGSPTETNTTIKGNVQGTNALSVTVNRVDITNNLGGFTQTGVNNTNTGTVGSGGGFIGNITGNITGNLTGDISAGTNLIYRYTTNIVGAANFVFGKAYWTNITANFTFPALTMQDNAAMETLSVWVTNSGASVFTATINGVAGAPGHVVPAVFYCTNATVTEIDVSHFGVFWTNACVGKN